MQKNKELQVTGFIIRNGEKLKRSELSTNEQSRLSIKWNKLAMETAGYTQLQKYEKKSTQSNTRLTNDNLF